MLERYGVESNNYIHLSPLTIDALKNPALFEELVSGLTIQEAAIKLNVNVSTIYHLTSDFNIRHLMKNIENSYEAEIKKILSISFYKDRKILNGKELDFYIPSHNMAIEIGSVFYHSEEANRGEFYHFNKWKNCQDNNITLLQYFDDDLFKYPHLIESKILRLCNKPLKIVGARKCNLNIVNNDEEIKFLNYWHFQGMNYKRNWKFGAYYQDELIAVMSIYHMLN